MRLLLSLLAFLALTTPALAWSFYTAAFPDSIEQPMILLDSNIKTRGVYYAKTKLIKIRDLYDSYAIAHEVGHFIFHETTQIILTDSSTSVGLPFPVCDSYVSDYAQTNYAEDAAESFAFFYFWREEFRKMAASDPCLMLKYRKIYRVFYPRNS